METSRRAFMLATAGAALATGANSAVAAEGTGLRLLTFERKDQLGARVGLAIAGDKVIDLVAAKKAGAALEFDPADMISLIAAGAPALAQVRAVAAKPGETLAVLGASGGVGLAAVELGKVMGAKVIACASSDEKLEFCKRYGADILFNYAKEDLKEGLKKIGDAKGIDIVFDPDPETKYAKALARLGIDPSFLVSDAGHA